MRTAGQSRQSLRYTLIVGQYRPGPRHDERGVRVLRAAWAGACAAYAYGSPVVSALGPEVGHGHERCAE